MADVMQRLNSIFIVPFWIFSVVSVVTSLSIPLCLATSDTPGSSAQLHSTPYRIVDGKVDRSTYLGWRVYHSACYTCHGVDGTGTSVAPNLVERVKTMSARDFVGDVLTRYRITLGYDAVAADDNTAVRQAFLEQVMKYERGELIMPTWERDPNVKPHVLDLYAYLRARADGELGPGRPGQIKQ